MRRRLSVASSLLALLVAVGVPTVAQPQQTAPTEPPLPTRPIEATADAESTIRIAVPNFLGRTPENSVAARVMRNHFRGGSARQS